MGKRVGKEEDNGRTQRYAAESEAQQLQIPRSLGGIMATKTSHLLSQLGGLHILGESAWDASSYVVPFARLPGHVPPERVTYRLIG